MATKMLEKFEKYWSQGIMGVATVLDPRYKFKLLHYYFPLLYSSEDAKKEIERIKEICVDLVNEYSVKFKASGGVGGSFQSLESSFTNPDEMESDLVMNQEEDKQSCYSYSCSHGRPR
ncbi:hypothetical protein ACS0TY_022284 [Phlomoides rotata]